MCASCNQPSSIMCIVKEVERKLKEQKTAHFAGRKIKFQEVRHYHGEILNDRIKEVQNHRGY